MSALSRRIRETNDELEIEQSNQELREQRGIARSPEQDFIDEDEYYDRHNIHKENVKDVINLYDNLDSQIDDILDDVIVNNQEYIDNMGSGAITPDVINDTSKAARNNTYLFMRVVVEQLLKNDDINDYPFTLLANEIFLSSLNDILWVYKQQNLSPISKNRRAQVMSKYIFDKLRIDGMIGNDPSIETLFYQNINTLVRKNISDGSSIKNGSKRLLRFNIGGKTKRKRRNHKKAHSRKPKKRITIKRKNNKK